MGWRELCISEDAMADRAHFLKIYDQLAEREEREAAVPLPVMEKIRQIAQKREAEREGQALGMESVGRLLFGAKRGEEEPAAERKKWEAGL